MYSSPVAPVTPTKAPSHLLRGEAVRRQLSYISTPSTVSTTPAATTPPPSLTDAQAVVGTFVTTPTGDRDGDTGVIMSNTAGECEVLWHSDKQRTKLPYGDLTLWEPSSARVTSAARTTKPPKKPKAVKYKS